MRAVKEYLMVAFLLLIYILAITLLLKQFYMYQKAYYGLSQLISHTSILTEEYGEEGK